MRRKSEVFFMKFRLIFSLLIFAQIFLYGDKSNPTANYQYTYKSVKEDQSTKTIWNVKQKDEMYYINGKSKNSLTEIECDDQGYFDRFYSKSFDQPIEYEIIRDGNHLWANGTFHGKKKSEYHFLKRNPWLQQLGFGLRAFAASTDETFYFCILNESDFALHDMVAKKQEIAPLKIDGKEYQAQKLHLTLPGFKGMFWSAEIWYDTKSGDCLLYKGNEGPKTPITTITLSSKKHLTKKNKKHS